MSYVLSVLYTYYVFGVTVAKSTIVLKQHIIMEQDPLVLLSSPTSLRFIFFWELFSCLMNLDESPIEIQFHFEVH